MMMSRPLRRLLVVVCILALPLGKSFAADLGLNPSISAPLTFVPGLDLFSGTFTILDGGSLNLTLDLSTSQSFAFQGTASALSHTLTTPTVTLLSGGSLTRSTPGTTTVSNHLNNGGTVSVTGGKLLFQSGTQFSNSSTVSVTGASSVLSLYDLQANTGTMTADGGTIELHGTYGRSSLGAMTIANGGTIALYDTLTNTGQTLNAPTGGAYTLKGTISGGAVAQGALQFTTAPATLQNVSVLGTSTSISALANITVTGGTNFATALGSLTLGNGATLSWQQTGTLEQAIAFGDNASLQVVGASNVLTLDRSTTATGNLNLYSDLSTGADIINYGTLEQSSATTAGSVYAATFTNRGTISVSAGSLNVGSPMIGSSFVNDGSGVLRVAGGTMSLLAPSSAQLTNLGTIDVQSGTLQTNGKLLNSEGLIQGGGTINGAVAFDGGTIAPGNSGIGSLTFASGTFTVIHPGVLAVQLGSESASELVFQNPTSLIDIGSGLISLSLTLTEAPTTAMTYNLIRISSGGNGLTGTFAGLPNNGDTFSSSYSGTPYYFSVNYGTNAISITALAVPEPSTYALFGMGLAALPFLRRRRKR